MPRRPRLHLPGAIYHVMSRGIEGREIFRGADDMRALMGILARVKEQELFKLYAYCFMPNHIHLLIKVEETSLSGIMHRTLTRHAVRFNNITDRMGYVFQGRFKAILCQDNAYFLELVRYIHRNPVRGGLTSDVGKWPWSSHWEYMGLRQWKIADVDFPLAVFHPQLQRARDIYSRFLRISDSGGIEPPFVEPASVARPEEKIWSWKPPKDLGEIGRDVAEKTGISLEAIHGPQKSRALTMARRVFSRCAQEEGFGITEIATYLHLSCGAVSKYVDRGERKLKSPAPLL